MSEKDKLDIELYNIYHDNCSDELKNKRLNFLANKYNISTNELHERYIWLVKMDINPNICHLDENHKIIYEIFDEYNKMLNENHIEYFYTSGILAYLLVDKELERYHHDLDIFINMKDLEKLEEICEKYNFTFERKNGIREDGTTRVMLKMYYQNRYDIPITAFMYVREKDNTIIQKDYYFDKENKEYVEYIYNSPIISQLSFSNIPNFHNNIKYYSITLEALFLCKTDNRPKDIYDCSIFKEFVNIEKLKQLKEAFKANLPNEIVDAKKDIYSNFIFSNHRKKKILTRK